MSKLYVAYGSNLNVEQMKHRCPNSELVNTGTLEGWKLAFKGGSNSYLTIDECEGASCPVAIWEIPEEDEKSLDMYEGYPTFYKKCDINVKLKDDSSQVAMVYIMNSEFDFGTPTVGYYNTVIRGYIDCGFDDKIGILSDAYEEAESKENEKLMAYYKSLRDKGLTDKEIFGYEYDY